MEFRNNQSIYLQIADNILESILAGELEGGDRIPSVREMASINQVNPNTVMRTFNFLQDKEIIFQKRGIGYFIDQEALKKTQDIKKEAFVKQYLPELFKMMDLLEINFKDLEKIKKDNFNGKQHSD